MDEVHALARRLVDVPSHEDETAAGDEIENWLREHTDADVTRDDAPNGGNIIARKGSGESVALVGHHDVVPPADEQIQDGEYVVSEESGRLYGRGAADMKGAVAAAMVAFRDADPDCELVFCSFVGEEQGGVGARHFLDRHDAADYAIVAEGSTSYTTDGVTDVVIAHKGRRGSTIRAQGVAAHASEPASGENAIYRASDAVDVVRELDAPAVDVLGERVEGSVAVTEIDGGSAWNVIPDACEVTVDERTVPGERADLRRVTSVPGVSWSVDQDLPPMECTSEAFADAVLDAANAAQDGTPQRVSKPHATDAGWLADEGTACVVCGASEPGEAHTKSESVSLDTLSVCYETYLGLANAWPVRED